MKAGSFEGTMSVRTRAAKSRFIIKRKDQEVDDVYLESEGLTIGRLTGNDLVLNHRAVSRTHAGIKEFKGEYWIFNLSESNGTLLNGELVNKTSLVDGDVLQIGPYTLQVNYIEDSLAITVEMEIEVNPLQPGTTKLLWDAGAEDSSTKTVLIQMPSVAKKKSVVTPSGARRVQGTGLMTSVLAPVNEQALNVFWGKRKREAGKLAPQTLLHPRGNKQVGKAQFNWRPTLDLSRIWRKSYFYWGVGPGRAAFDRGIHDLRRRVLARRDHARAPVYSAARRRECYRAAGQRKLLLELSRGDAGHAG